MRYGTIIKYFDDKKFGFIQSDTGQDVFFHISALGAVDAPLAITAGQPVKYELLPRGEVDPGARPANGKDRSKQPSAKLVTLIDKIPGGLASEVASKRHPRARKKKPTWRR